MEPYSPFKSTLSTSFPYSFPPLILPLKRQGQVPPRLGMHETDRIYLWPINPWVNPMKITCLHQKYQHHQVYTVLIIFWSLWSETGVVWPNRFLRLFIYFSLVLIFDLAAMIPFTTLPMSMLPYDKGFKEVPQHQLHNF